MKQLMLASATMILASCTATGPQASSAGARAGRDCFNTSFVTGYSTVDRDTLRLDAGPGRRYEVDIQGPLCEQIDWTHRIALVSKPSSWICVGDQPGQGDIYFFDSTTQSRVSCYIQEVRRVSEAK